MQVDKVKLKASIMRDSFFEFVKEMWPVIIQEEPVYNWHIPYLCNELQIVAERVFVNKPKEYDLIVNISPGSTKSSLASVMFPAWVWTRMASCRTICASYTHNLAISLSVKSRDIVMSERYKKYFPEIQIREDLNTKQLFVNTQRGSRYCVSTSANIIGEHAHIHIVDDPLDPKAARSETAIKEANMWLSDTLSTRKVNKAVTPLIMIMQRLAEDDCTGYLLAKSGKNIKHICLPATDDYEVKPPELREKYINGLFDPVRLSQETLDDIKNNDMSEYGYAGQFGQSPIPLGASMFDISVPEIVSTIDPAAIAAVYRFWDKAATQDGGCRTAGVKIARLKDNSYVVLDVIKGQWRADIRNKLMRDTAATDGYDVDIGIEEEPGSGGKESAEYTIKDLAGYSVRTDKPTGDKVARAEPFSIQFNVGNVKIMNASWTEEFLRELQYFPKGKFKDQVDAAAGAFNLLARKRSAAIW